MSERRGQKVTLVPKRVPVPPPPPPTANGGPVYCSHCGAENPQGARFCQGCGKLLNP